jgi:hypothetical protein
MSSAIRSLDQTDRRIQYLYAVAGLTEATAVSDEVVNGNIVPISSSTTVNSVMSMTAFAEAIGSATELTFGAGTIFRDMGKQIVVNNGQLDLAVWRRVQVVNDDGNGFEGVPYNSNVDLYVLTWVAGPVTGDDYVVLVARTG